MRVHVDRTKCSGIGLCEMTAPAIFEIGDDGQSQVIDEDPPETERAAAEEAVSNCPTGALSIED
ncbi:ferredoxin [Mycobacterium sp. CVI_P3]|uniref:Ferredoxin n=1 Tax=Mycobacterium pinniadriaticum TaxID=2994102 RepID=A0ABT3SBX8_9MYCO|nr:ferredoxin [Mycobacterium pinniadriaticum]MCX2929936.1 ferredoxin [Mycobacterium pinniadriaticum]MCX2936415.1 ferredoxin [Mycobacterium pinniadriaticum]